MGTKLYYQDCIFIMFDTVMLVLCMHRYVGMGCATSTISLLQAVTQVVSDIVNKGSGNKTCTLPLALVICRRCGLPSRTNCKCSIGVAV